MAMYRKKPVIVEAWQWTSEHDYHRGVYTDTSGAFVDTIHGQRAYLAVGDWIITEPDGIHFYPCKPDIFAATYEPAGTERLPDVDTSDIPETSEDWFANAKVGGELRPPDVEAMPPGARADAMQPAGGYHEPNPPEDSYHHPNQRATRFRDEIEQVINSHSRENGSGTPDFVLAQFVLDVMDAFDSAVTRRQAWYGRPTDEKALIKMLNERLQAEGEHTAAGQAEIERLGTVVAVLQNQLERSHKIIESVEGQIEAKEAENAQLRGELQRVSMAGLTPSMVVGK